MINMNLWGITIILMAEIGVNLESWFTLVAGKQKKKAWIVVYYVGIWSLWLTRNKLKFQNVDLCWNKFDLERSKT